MNWEYIKTLYWVVQSGSFSKAADELQTTQATVTRRIQELENNVGHKLFVRSNKGCQLTALGHQFYLKAKAMFLEYETIPEIISEAESQKRTIIITCAEMTSVLLSKKLHILYENIEGVDIVIKSTNEFLDLSKREADIAIRNRKPSTGSYKFSELNRGELNTYSVFGNNKPFRNSKKIRVKDFKKYDWVVFSKSKAKPAVEWLEKNVDTKSIKYKVHHAALVMDVVSNTPNTLALLPRFVGVVLDNITELYRPKGADLFFKHYIVRRDEKDEIVRKLVKNLKKVFVK